MVAWGDSLEGTPAHQQGRILRVQGRKESSLGSPGRALWQLVGLGQQDETPPGLGGGRSPALLRIALEEADNDRNQACPLALPKAIQGSEADIRVFVIQGELEECLKVHLVRVFR